MLTRRTFLAASATAPLVFARASGRPASEKITLGFVGVGMMGRGHLGTFLGLPEVEVVAVCDVVKERLDGAKATAEKRYADRIKSGVYKGVTPYTDFRDLLAHKGLDAVVIATPDHWHHIPCVLAARAGKHIYCEKPLTHNIAEGREIVNAVKKAKIAFQTGSQQRSEYASRFRAAVEMIWNGWIGTVKTVRIGVGGPSRPCDLKGEEKPAGTDWDTWLGPAPDREYSSALCPKGVHTHFPAWRDYREYGGGPLADMGAHHFDIAQWALKMDASGPTEITPPENPKKGSGLRFVYANGVTMIHNEFEKDKDGKEFAKADCVFEGTDGTLLVGRNQLELRMKNGNPTKFPDQPQRVYPSTSHPKNWLECIVSGKETICPPETGHRSASVCHLGNIGYRLGRKLKWDATKEQFVDDEKANKELSREARAKWKL